MSQYYCNRCGAAAYYDGRCGDGPILTCGCSESGTWVDDGRGGYWSNPDNAQPVEGQPPPRRRTRMDDV